MRIYFDVGAHDGLTSIPLLQAGKYDHCYAFEINPKSLEELKKNVRKYKLENRYTIIEKAAGSSEDTVAFNIFNKSNVGSLFTPSESTLKKRYQDFGNYVSIQVEVIKLVNICKEYDIQQIDFLHVDTQGNDYEVLKGLEDCIKLVRAGEVEVMNENPLYTGVTNSDKECRTFLEQNGFKVLTPRRVGEYDLKFER